MLWFCQMSLHLCAAILHQGSWQCLTAIQRGLKASRGDTTAPCTSKYYISLMPVGNIFESALAVLFMSYFLPSCCFLSGIFYLSLCINSSLSRLSLQCIFLIIKTSHMTVPTGNQKHRIQLVEVFLNKKKEKVLNILEVPEN